MRLTGQMFEVEGLDEFSSDVTEAVVTNSKISFDWDEDGEFMHAELHSTDGGTEYKGHFGSPRPEKGCVMEATRFQSKDGGVLLWLKWHRKDTGFEGDSILYLASSWEE
jgi:hypothetical protein